MEVIVLSAVIFICFLHSQIVEDVQLRTEVVEPKKNEYFGDSNNRLVRYSNGPKQSDQRMARYSDGDLNSVPVPGI